MFRLSFIITLLLGLAACSSGIVTYSEKNYDRLRDVTGIEIRMIDGKTFLFYRVEVMQFDDKEIRMKTWVNKNSQPVEYVFRRADIVIQKSPPRYSQTAFQLITIALAIGILTLLNRWLY